MLPSSEGRFWRVGVASALGCEPVRRSGGERPASGSAPFAGTPPLATGSVDRCGGMYMRTAVAARPGSNCEGITRRCWGHF